MLSRKKNNKRANKASQQENIKIVNVREVKSPAKNYPRATSESITKQNTSKRIKIALNDITTPSESETVKILPGNNEMDSLTQDTVEIVAAKKTSEGKRIRNKKHCYYYCHKMILHIGRHIEVKHANKIDVARILAFPKKSARRKEMFTEITRAGDFHHNCEVMAVKQGELILVRRPTTNEALINDNYKDYGPCPNCLGFMLKTHLWHHLKTSCFKKDMDKSTNDQGQANRQVIAESNAILSNVFGADFSTSYKDNIVNNLREDDIGECCREDSLILKFGAMQFEKYGTTQMEMIRQQMRQIARLTMTVRETTKLNLKLRDLLVPQMFDTIVQGVKTLCGRNQNDVTKRPEFDTPSLALKLGHLLKKSANIERGLALRQENLRKNENLVSFCSLMEMEWQTRISSNALSTLYKRKLNAGQLLPVTDDLLKCTSYITKGIEEARIMLTRNVTPENYSRLAKFVLCRIILFNKRRAGEASKMTVDQFTTRPSWSNTNQELKSALTPYELKLADRHVIVHIFGKRGRIVPVLLTPETKLGIDVLLKHRSETVGINSNNQYVFARGTFALSHLRGTEVLKKIVSEIDNLKEPSLITSTKLRKYVATVSQVFDLSENEYDWLARHLGHDIRVHREFYRLHEDVVELTKVSRLLMAVDAGEANKFAGKKLKDIAIADLPPIEEDDENDDFELEDVHENDVPEADTPANENVKESNFIPKTRCIKNIKKGVANKICHTRTPWDVQDKKAVLEFFRIQVKNGIVPGKTECEQCQEKHPNLKKRKWSDLKFCIMNQIKKIKNFKK